MFSLPSWTPWSRERRPDLYEPLDRDMFLGMAAIGALLVVVSSAWEFDWSPRFWIASAVLLVCIGFARERLLFLGALAAFIVLGAAVVLAAWLAEKAGVDEYLAVPILAVYVGILIVRKVRRRRIAAAVFGKHCPKGGVPVDARRCSIALVDTEDGGKENRGCIHRCSCDEWTWYLPSGDVRHVAHD